MLPNFIIIFYLIFEYAKNRRITYQVSTRCGLHRFQITTRLLQSTPFCHCWPHLILTEARFISFYLVVKDENGRVKTEERNVFSGITASGVLKKTFFNYESSVFQGDPYMDPGKIERL